MRASFPGINAERDLAGCNIALVETRLTLSLASHPSLASSIVRTLLWGAAALSFLASFIAP